MATVSKHDYHSISISINYMSSVLKSLLSLCLFPFALLYGTGVIIRNLLFDLRILKSTSFSIPVISVGNITVGGTGKTPHTEYLIQLLKQEFKTAVLSRGYKRKSKGFVLASTLTTMEQIGDEPYQMKHKFPEIHMAVDRDRCHGITKLTEPGSNLEVEVILLDDAFQHRYVKPGLSILLIDYNRPVYSDFLLPAGRLREPASGKKRADILLVTKCPETMGPDEQNHIREKLNPLPGQALYFTQFVYDDLYLLTSPTSKRDIQSLTNDTEILLVTGIASPHSLIKKLSVYTPHVNPLTFPDHHDFTEDDIKLIQRKFEQLSPGKRLIITTEKDAARLTSHPLMPNNIKGNTYVLPIKVAFLNQSDQSFNQKIIEYVRQNSRNSVLLKK